MDKNLITKNKESDESGSFTFPELLLEIVNNNVICFILLKAINFYTPWKWFVILTFFDIKGYFQGRKNRTQREKYYDLTNILCMVFTIVYCLHYFINQIYYCYVFYSTISQNTCVTDDFRYSRIINFVTFYVIDLLYLFTYIVILVCFLNECFVKNNSNYSHTLKFMFLTIIPLVLRIFFSRIFSVVENKFVFGFTISLVGYIIFYIAIKMVFIKKSFDKKYNLFVKALMLNIISVFFFQKMIHDLNAFNYFHNDLPFPTVFDYEFYFNGIKNIFRLN